MEACARPRGGRKEEASEHHQGGVNLKQHERHQGCHRWAKAGGVQHQLGTNNRRLEQERGRCLKCNLLFSEEAADEEEKRRLQE